MAAVRDIANHVLSISVALIIGVGLFGGAGVWMMTMSVPAMLEGARSLQYRPVEGVLAAAEAHQGGRGAEISYTYSVDGREYTGSRISLEVAERGDEHVEPIREEVRFARRHSAGDAITVYFDPQSPQRSVLQVGIPDGAAVMLGMAMPFATIGLAFVMMVIEMTVRGPKRMGGYVLVDSPARSVYRRAKIGFFVKCAAFVVALPVGLGLSLWSYFIGAPQSLIPPVMVITLVVLCAVIAAGIGWTLVGRGWFDLVIDREAGVLVPPRGLSRQAPAVLPLDSIRSVEAVEVEKVLPRWLAIMQDRDGGPMPVVADMLHLRLPSVRAKPALAEARGPSYFSASAVIAHLHGARGTSAEELLWFAYEPRHAQPVRDWIAVRIESTSAKEMAVSA